MARLTRHGLLKIVKYARKTGWGGLTEEFASRGHDVVAMQHALQPIFGRRLLADQPFPMGDQGAQFADLDRRQDQVGRQQPGQNQTFMQVHKTRDVIR